MMTTRLRLTMFALATVTVAACQRGDDDVDMLPGDSVAAAPAPTAMATVASIETGKRIGADKRITDTTSTFAPNDTLYISVVTNNASASTQLKTVVTFQDGQVVDSSSQTVAAPTTMGGTSVTEFHLSRPGGWPTGDYTVEVWLDGQSAGTRTLTVRR